ncbi:MAG: SDR family oxidoreductase [Ruminococcus flavefaciens]|nr:SDR family oxidoreductase [Ruminococcus flavefaciens]
MTCFHLEKKRILITGASSGIGRETAILCSSLGAEVTLLARDSERLKQTMSLLKGSRHAYYSFDLINVEEIEDFLKKIIENRGAFDGFVHSAGVDYIRPLRMLKPAFLNDLMTINFYSFVELVRCLTKRSNYRKGMSIVALSSISSKRGSPSKTAYCSSKAALDASIRCMAAELASKNIRVNSVMPALVNTELYQKVKDSVNDSDDFNSVIRQQYAGISEATDIAYLIAFLLHEHSNQITGANMDISGGFLST